MPFLNTLKNAFKMDLKMHFFLNAFDDLPKYHLKIDLEQLLPTFV
jgi:hypothetical protein